MSDCDEGGVSERTFLAWERTAVASVAVAALVLRAGIVERRLGLAIPITAVLVVAAAAEWLFSRQVYLGHQGARTGGPVLHPRAISALGAVTLVAAVASTALAAGS